MAAPMPIADLKADVNPLVDAFQSTKEKMPDWYIGKVVSVQGIPFTIKSIAKGGRLILKVKR